MEHFNTDFPNPCINADSIEIEKKKEKSIENNEICGMEMQLLYIHLTIQIDK